MADQGLTETFDIKGKDVDIKGVCKILQDGRTLCKVQSTKDGQAPSKLNFVIDENGRVMPFQYMGPAKNVGSLASLTIERTKAYLTKIGKTLHLTS